MTMKMDTETDNSDDEPWIDEEILEQLRPLDERPTVPVFYNIPPEAADRAIEHATRRHKTDPDRDLETLLLDAVYDEVREVPVVFVGEEPLEEYAADELDALEADTAATVK